MLQTPFDHRHHFDEISESTPLNYRGLPVTSLGLLSLNVVNGLEPDKESYTTLDVLKANVYRFMLQVILSIYIFMFDFMSMFSNFNFLLKVFAFDLKIQTSRFHADPNLYWYSKILDLCIYYKSIIIFCFGLLWKVFNPRRVIPIGLQNCLRYIPRLNTPETVTLILHSNSPRLKPPPEIPVPYLDADRKLIVPEKRDIQYFVAMKNEYQAQVKTHNAAEKVRILGEIGRFITWCCLVPTINQVSIYEKSALCWDGTSEFVESIKNSILVELIALVNTFEPMEMRKFKKVLPKIILIDKFSKTEFTVNGGSSDLDDLDSQIDQGNEPENYGEIWLNRTRLIVNLCDERIRDVNFQRLSSRIINDEIKPDDLIFTEEFPATSQLIITPKTMNFKNRLNGYFCIDESINSKTKSFVYFSDLPFGFQFFSQSLYKYALDLPFMIDNQFRKNKLEQEVSDEELDD